MEAETLWERMDPDDLWLQARVRFRRVAWFDLRPGDLIYYLTERQEELLARGRLLPGEEDHVFGPLTVVDPEQCRLRNREGVEMNMPGVRPLLFVSDR